MWTSCLAIGITNQQNVAAASEWHRSQRFNFIFGVKQFINEYMFFICERHVCIACMLRCFGDEFSRFTGDGSRLQYHHNDVIHICWIVLCIHLVIITLTLTNRWRQQHLLSMVELANKRMTIATRDAQQCLEFIANPLRSISIALRMRSELRKQNVCRAHELENRIRNYLHDIISYFVIDSDVNYSKWKMIACVSERKREKNVEMEACGWKLSGSIWATVFSIWKFQQRPHSHNIAIV